MFETHQENFIRQASLHHQRRLHESEEARLIESATPRTPNAWDTFALTTGNWLIKLGNTLKDQSLHTKLSGKHA